MKPLNDIRFKDYIWRELRNRRYLLIAIAGTVLQFTIFKFLYPFADFFSDSYSYIDAAQLNLNVSIWPIGYSKFLKFIHYFTHSDTAVVTIQYAFIQLANIYFFFTICYFLETSKKTKLVLYVFLFFNPLFLYVCNYINSDPLFACISLLWFTQLIWIIYRPSTQLLFTHGVLLFLAFTVRNNAYYYPAISIIAFILSKQKTWRKLLGVTFPLILIGLFIEHTKEAAYKMTGVRQFSFFTGWQLANNALYGFPDINIDTNKLPTSESKDLYKMSKAFYLKVPKDFNSVILKNNVGNFFIVDPEAPLKEYMARTYKITNKYDFIVAWGKASAVFKPYGVYLLKENPSAYIKHFVTINIKNYLLPPLEKLKYYNQLQESVRSSAQSWFDYKMPFVSSISPIIQGKLLMWIPTVFLLLNIYFVAILSWVLFKGREKLKSISYKPFFILTSLLIISNVIFSITTAMIVFRYQFFPMIIILTLTLKMLETMDLYEKKRSATKLKDAIETATC